MVEKILVVVGVICIVIGAVLVISLPGGSGAATANSLSEAARGIFTAIAGLVLIVIAVSIDDH